jgi:hypothetical protein
MKEPNQSIVFPENKITAEEARKFSPNYKLIESFLSVVYAGVRKAAVKGERTYTYTIYNEEIGDVRALYNRETDRTKILTATGLECVKLLEKDGYTVHLGLFYEEKQFVDMQLNFVIKW